MVTPFCPQSVWNSGKFLCGNPKESNMRGRQSFACVSAEVAISILFIPLVNASCFPAIFNFGDSQSDTGGIQASFPGFTPAEYPPYGETFFGSPQYRYCDGRLLIDFIAEGLGLPFLDPYLQSVTSDFKHGANFATAGATVQAVTYLSPFHLAIQTQQFVMFKKLVLEFRDRKKWSWQRTSTDVKSASSTYSERVNRLPLPEYFSQALYTICIGGNDFTWGYTQYKPMSFVKEFLPNVADGIVASIKRLHDEGEGRNFLVWDMEPQGCLPYMKTLIPHKPEDLDDKDCLPEYNAASQFFNDLLRRALDDLRAQWNDGTNIVVFSTYELKSDIFKDPAKAGFKTVEKACCGIPNTYHYDLRVACGQRNVIDNETLISETCNNPSDYVVWDGVHTTEAANRYQAKQLFAGRYLHPAFPKLTHGCDLSPLT